MNAYFGEPWDAPIVDGQTREHTPIGNPCAWCQVPIATGDQGILMGAITGPPQRPLASRVPYHRECLMRSTIGSPAHLDGKCTAGLPINKSNYTLSVEEGPFEAFPVRCGMTFCYGGLKIDPKNGQVQHVAGRPIPGLYAAGEMAGGLWVGNYASGSGMMAGATFGRIAGNGAAAAALSS